jgi:bacterioferritin
MNLIQLLNEDLSLEYANAIQYLQHSNMVKGLYAAFKDELEDHYEDELKHAKMLNERIIILGGVPIVSVSQMFTASDSVAMIQQDLAGESVAIERYTERITQAHDMADYGTAHILKNILVDEQGHKNDLETILDE